MTLLISIILFFLLAPSAPVNISINSTLSSMWFHWLPPVYPNGKIVKYQYMFHRTSQLNNDTLFELSDTAREIEFDGLEFYTQYSFKIRAINTLDGEWSQTFKRYTDPNRKYFLKYHLATYY